MVVIKKAELADATVIAHLAQQLWPHHQVFELQPEFEALLQDANAAVFAAYQGRMPVGFAQCQLRHDYVEGTSTSPVGYLEGIFVLPEYRNSGIARMLLKACEQWVKSLGCTEFASDCELGNPESLRFHLKAGFEEANRIICFTKKV